jgi:hypothetical protein
MSKKRVLSGKKKSKVWTSDGSIIDGKEIRSSAPWYRSPHRLAAKAAKILTLR